MAFELNAPSKIKSITSAYTGPRFRNGRPKVADDIVERIFAAGVRLGLFARRRFARRRFARLLAQRAHPLDQLQELWPVLADQGLAQQVAEQPDVRTQCRAGSG